MRKYINEEVFSSDDNKRKEIIREAVTQAIDECILENVLKDFFLKYRKEVVEVSVLEYSAERHVQAVIDENFGMGLDRGIIGMVSTMRKHGFDDATILNDLCEQYELKPEEAKKYL